MCRKKSVWNFAFILNLFYFFSLPDCYHATIQTCPGQEVKHIRQQAAQFEVSLVFYYSSWCKYSKQAKIVYHEVAQHFEDQLHFATVDCWHLACNCSVGLTQQPPYRWHSWPTLYIHFGRNISLQYYGEWTFAELARFINALLKPIDRVHSKYELKALSFHCDAVVLGLFTSPETAEYRYFATAAVKWLETDPLRNFRFAVAFGTAANEILKETQTKLPTILLTNIKGIEQFPRIQKWNATLIISWLKMDLKNAFMQYVHGYSNPSTIANKVQMGVPVLAIFANDMEPHANFYTLMEKELEASKAVQLQEQSISYCEKFWSTIHTQHQVGNYAISAPIKTDSSMSYRRECLSTHNMQFYYVINRYLNNFFCNFKANALYAEDPYSSARLLELYQYYKCLHHAQVPKPETKIAVTKFIKKSTDLLWLQTVPRQNRSLAVVVLDTPKYKDFLQAHGIHNTHLNPATALIIDPQRESIFVLQEQFTFQSLLFFVRNYYGNNLPISHKSSSHHAPTPKALNAIQLQSMNRQMFLNIMLQQNVTTVALLHSPECAFSSLMSHTLIQVAALLDTNEVRFVRIDTQANDLPWELFMSHTPALIIFPRGRYMDSRLFPSHFKIDVRNVLGFILAQLEPVDQVKLVLGSCRQIFAPERLQRCLQFAKTLVTQHIGTNLKFWQIFKDERSLVLERLKQFKDLSLDIQRNF